MINKDSAAYKSFDDYRLLNDGYVESLLTVQLEQEGVHVYVAKMKPFMKLKTYEGKDHYDLCGLFSRAKVRTAAVYSKLYVSVKAVEKGACKHIAATMYPLEGLFNTHGKDSVTSGPCVWVRRPRANTKACAVKDLRHRERQKTFPQQEKTEASLLSKH